MKRKIVYVGSIPQDVDLLDTNRNLLISIGHVLQDMLGTSTLFSGLGCVPTTPAGMTVNVNPGRAYSLQSVDTGAYGSLAADAHQVMKQGILLDAVNFSCPAPTTAGYSINYLVEAAFQEVDTGAQVLPFYNAANPASAYSGPNGTGASSYTARDNTVQLQLKAGVAATTGSQITPTPDAGFTGLWVISVPYGATTITSGNISQYSGAPFLSADLLTQVNARALLAGSSSQTFNVAPATQGQHAVQFKQVVGIAGSAGNLKCVMTAVGTSLPYSADQLLVASALNGLTYMIPSFSANISALDTGTLAANSYYAVYGYLKSDGTTGGFLQLEPSGGAPAVYGGANPPANMIASGLIGVWPTNGSAQFIVGSQYGRTLNFAGTGVYSGSGAVSLATVNLASVVPKSAKFAIGTLSITVSSSGVSSYNIFDQTATGASTVLISVNTGGASAGGASNNFGKFPILTPQTWYLSSTQSATISNMTITLTGYEF
jgi:hypothetical protein